MKNRLAALAALAVGGIILAGCGGAASTQQAIPPTQNPTDQVTESSAPESTGAADQPTPEAATEESAAPSSAPLDGPVTITEYPVPPGSHPHDVAPEPGGGVWYTGQNVGQLGLLDPATGEIEIVELGRGSRPHGVIIGPDGAAWVTDGGQNAIVRVDGTTHEVKVFPLPAGTRNANLNTAAFDPSGILWFTGQAGIYGRLDPASGEVQVWDSPRGNGPYGITSTPGGRVFYASLAGSHIAEIDTATFQSTPIDPPTPNQGSRRVWSDSAGIIWVSEYPAGQVGRYDPASGAWKEWHLPNPAALTYAVYVDDRDVVWLTDFASNAIVRFVPGMEKFDVFELPSAGASVRQLLGRPGEVWGAESGVDKLVVLDTGD